MGICVPHWLQKLALLTRGEPQLPQNLFTDIVDLPMLNP